MTKQFSNIPFVSYFLTTNNHDNPNFFERDTFSYRFNRNIVTHTQSRYLVAHIPKSFEELVLPWPLSSFVEEQSQTNGKAEINIDYLTRRLNELIENPFFHVPGF